MMRKTRKKRKVGKKICVASIAVIVICSSIVFSFFKIFSILLRSDIADTFKGLIIIPFIIFILAAWSILGKFFPNESENEWIDDL